MEAMFDPRAFGTRLRELREGPPPRIGRAEIALRLGVSRNLVGQWERGEKVPRPDDIFRLCKLFSVSADYLLGLESGRIDGEESTNGLRWRTARLSPEVYGPIDQIQIGIDLFRSLVVERKTSKTLQQSEPYASHSTDSLRRMLKMAFMSGAIELLSVESNADWSNRLKQAYDGLRQCVVTNVDLPPNDRLADSVVRPEIVAFIASREAVARLGGTMKVGLSGGTTLARFVDFLPHGSPNLAGIKWYSLLATKRQPSAGVSTANHVVGRVAYNQPGSEGYRLPFIPHNLRGNEARFQARDHIRDQLELAHHLLEESEEIQEAFISLGSDEYNYRQNNYNMGLEQLGTLLDQLSSEERSQLAGDILLHLVNKSGLPLGDSEFQKQNERLVFSIGLPRLLRISSINNVWALVTRESKTHIARASLRAGYVNGLILDKAVARSLLRLASE